MLALQQAFMHGGNATFSGIVTASSFVGDGSNLTNLNVSAAGWGQVDTTYAGAGSTGISMHSDLVMYQIMRESVLEHHCSLPT